MTDDIVARLRGFWQPNDTQSSLRDDAADEIERLRMELNESRLEICILRAPSTLAGDPADDVLRAFYD